ncbi:MAG: hypothetical protein Q7S64_02510 [bacterium]|nr:hypothetical protein [bacterium]
MPTALLSVYHKEGIGEFAAQLRALGFDLIGSTATVKTIQAYDPNLPIRDIAEIVGTCPVLGHPVDGLSLQLHAGLVADLDNPADLAAIESHGIAPIHLAYVELNRLDEYITGAGPNDFCTVLSKIDGAGPALIRSAAIGRRPIITCKEQRLKLLEWLRAGQPERDRFLASLAAKAEMVVSMYSMVANEFWHQAYSGIIFSPTGQSSALSAGWPTQLNLTVDWLDGNMPTSSLIDASFVTNGPIPVELVKWHRLLPLHRDEHGEIVVAMDDPTDIMALDDLRMTGLRVIVVKASKQRLEEILVQLLPPDSPH